MKQLEEQSEADREAMNAMRDAIMGMHDQLMKHDAAIKKFQNYDVSLNKNIILTPIEHLVCVMGLSSTYASASCSIVNALIVFIIQHMCSKCTSMCPKPDKQVSMQGLNC